MCRRRGPPEIEPVILPTTLERVRGRIDTVGQQGGVVMFDHGALVLAPRVHIERVHHEERNVVHRLREHHVTEVDEGAPARNQRMAAVSDADLPLQ